MASTYDQWAEIYDAVYAYARDDIPFYLEEAKRSAGPVLELGCGTGRVSIPIAAAGIDVTGIDSSRAMLAVARRKLRRQPALRSRLTLVGADMRDFSLPKRFALAIIPFRGLLALLSVGDQVSALHAIRRHLAPEGTLAFNVFVPDLDMLVSAGDTAYHLRDVTDPETGARLVVWHQSRYDNHNQLIATRTIIEELDDDGAVKRRLYRDFQLRYSFRWELHHLLTTCGFEVVDLWGEFDRSPFDESSTEMVWVARPTT